MDPKTKWEEWKSKGILPVMSFLELQKIYEALKRYAEKIGADPSTYANEALDELDPLLSYQENVDNLRKKGYDLIFTYEEEREIDTAIEIRKQQLIKELSDLDPKFRELWKEFTHYQVENVNLKRKVRELTEKLKKAKTALEKLEAERGISEAKGKISKNEEILRDLKKKLEERIEEPRVERLSEFLKEVERRIKIRGLPLSKGFIGYKDFAKRFYNAVKPFDSYKFIPYFIELWANMIKDPSRAYNIFVEGVNLLLSKLQRPELTKADVAKLAENWLKEHKIKYAVSIGLFLDLYWHRLEPYAKKGDVEGILNELDKILPEFIIREEEARRKFKKEERERAEREVRTSVSPIIFDRREMRRMLVQILNSILGIAPIMPTVRVTPRGTRVTRMIRGEAPPYLTHPVAVDREGYPSTDVLIFIKRVYKNLLEREIWIKEKRPPTEEEKAKMEIWKNLEENPPSKEEIRRILMEIWERTQSPSIRSWITRLLELMRMRD
jgi:hypothetical protein